MRYILEADILQKCCKHCKYAGSDLTFCESQCDFWKQLQEAKSIEVVPCMLCVHAQQQKDPFALIFCKEHHCQMGDRDWCCDGEEIEV